MKTTGLLVFVLLFGLNALAVPPDDFRTTCASTLAEDASRLQKVLGRIVVAEIFKKARQVMDAHVAVGSTLVGITRVAHETVNGTAQVHVYLTFAKDAKKYYLVAILDPETSRTVTIVFPGQDRAYSIDFER